MRSLAVLATFAALTAAASCGGGGADSSPTTASTEATLVATTAVATTNVVTTSAAPTTTEPPTVGADWQQFDTPFAPRSAIEAAGRLWIVGRDGELPLLASTVDGAEWTQHDLPSLGLPTTTTLSVPGSAVGSAVLGAWNDTLYVVIAAQPQPGVSAEGVSADLWVATTEGAQDGTVRLVPPSESGLDQRLVGPENFRITSLTAPVSGTERPAFTAIGQWWEPFKTGDGDFAAIELGPDGRWGISSIDIDDGRTFQDFHGAVLNGTPVAVGATFGAAPSLVVWTRTETGWQTTTAPLPEGTTEATVSGVSAGPDRLVAVGNVDGRPVAWVSRDGSLWELQELPDTDRATDSLVHIVATDDGFVAVSSRPSLDGPVWTSTDGIVWEVVGELGARALATWDGGVVSVLDAVWVSPPR